MTQTFKSRFDVHDSGSRAAGTAIFAAVFIVAVAAQNSANRFHPFHYWGVTVATTTVGTTMAEEKGKYGCWPRAVDPLPASFGGAEVDFHLIRRHVGQMLLKPSSDGAFQT